MFVEVFVWAPEQNIKLMCIIDVWEGNFSSIFHSRLRWLFGVWRILFEKCLEWIGSIRRFLLNKNYTQTMKIPILDALEENKMQNMIPCDMKYDENTIVFSLIDFGQEMFVVCRNTYAHTNHVQSCGVLISNFTRTNVSIYVWEMVYSPIFNRAKPIFIFRHTSVQILGVRLLENTTIAAHQRNTTCLTIHKPCLHAHELYSSYNCSPQSYQHAEHSCYTHKDTCVRIHRIQYNITINWADHLMRLLWPNFFLRSQSLRDHIHLINQKHSGYIVERVLRCSYIITQFGCI